MREEWDTVWRLQFFNCRIVDPALSIPIQNPSMDPGYIWLSLVFLVPLVVGELWRILSGKEEPWLESRLLYPALFVWIFLIWSLGRFEAREFFYFQF